MSDLIMGTWDEEEHGGKAVCQLYVDNVAAISDFLANPYRRNVKFYAVVCELELTLQEKEENNRGKLCHICQTKLETMHPYGDLRCPKCKELR